MPHSPVPALLSRIKGTIACHHMLEPRDHIGVAVSGGVDSVVLLDVLARLREELPIDLTVLHLNHGMRGEEATRDQRFVQALSKQYALPCVDKEVDCPRYREEHSLSPEAAARELRYRFFEEAIEGHNLDKVAIGQTADDQAETVLMRIIKGGGTRGLKGIPPVRGRYIRPLIEVWHEELLHYARHKGFQFVQDSTNFQNDYLRNRIRHELLPILQGYNPAIKERLLHLAQMLGEDEGYLEGLTNEVTKRLVIGDEECSIPISDFLCLPQALQSRVLQHAFAGLSSGGVLEYPHIKGIKDLIQGGGGSKRLALPGGYWAMRVYDTLMLGQETKEPRGLAKAIDLTIPGRTRLNGFDWEIEAVVSDRRTSPRPDPETAYLDYHHLTFPLRVRSFRPGDSFIPLGMNGHKKLKAFFIDLKIPRAQRAKIPLVISGDDICWVGGLRIDERFKIGKDTRKVLQLTMKRL
ncbi:MAG: tRNA lysidine(34) synthetase TilS [Deltaproteobacteria bacterium]|nr:tRNA lysidine(34) synthetase TilS [Deltaproteobacteria bacterium]